jgi:hypothetical protein
MNDRGRLEQLRALLVRLERMPASAEREWMIGEVRARAVDVETGEKPAAMRALSEDGEEAVPPPKPRRRRPSHRPAVRTVWSTPGATPATPAPRSSPAAPGRPTAHESAVDLLEQGGVMCLDDEPAVADGASRPWSVGLRG